MEEFDFDISEFEQQVLDWLVYWNNNKNPSNLTEHAEKNFARQSKSRGCGFLITIFFIKIARFFEELARKDALNDSKSLECEKRAKTLLLEQNLKEILCKTFSKQSITEKRDKENVVKTIIGLIGKKSVREEFSIPLEPRLFAFIAYELLREGVKEYCQN
jgi:hypothetical protein